jgi:branched-chain amino acid transport system substrate-binding protein
MRAKPSYLVTRRHRALVAGLLALPLVALTACGNGGGSSSNSASSSSSAGSSASGSSSAAAAGGAYNLALVSDLSGPFSSVSAPGAAGVEVAVDNINANGGINGKKLNLSVTDSQSTPSLALSASQKAIAGSPLALFMLAGSGDAAAIGQLAQSAQIPLLSPALSDTSVYPAQPYLYQPGLTAQQNAQAMYAFVKRQEGHLSGKVIDVAAIQSPYVQLIINDVSKLLTAQGAKVNAAQQYNLPLASFATQANAIARDKPNVVLTLGATDDTVVVSKALTQAGVTAIQVGIPSGAGQQTLQQIGSAKYYGLTADPYASEAPSFLAAATSVGKKSDVSGSIFAMSGWVAVYMLADALKQCGANCTSSQLNTALQHVSNLTIPDGVSYGPVAFSATSHAAVSTVRFRSYDPATGKFSESAPISVG